MIRQLVHPVDPLLLVAGVRDKLLGLKPESNLILRCLRAIASMNDVSSNNNSKITPDGSWFRFLWVCSANKFPPVLDNTLSFPNHGKYGARAKEVAQSTEERSFFEIMIVLLGKFLGWNHQLDGNELESFSLKPGHYLRNEASLDAVRLDGDEGALHLCRMRLLILEHVRGGGYGGKPLVPVGGGGGCSTAGLVVGVCGGEFAPAEIRQRGEGGVPPVCEDGGARGGGGGEERPCGLARRLAELGGGAHGGGERGRRLCGGAEAEAEEIGRAHV